MKTLIYISLAVLTSGALARAEEDPQPHLDKLFRRRIDDAIEKTQLEEDADARDRAEREIERVTKQDASFVDLWEKRRIKQQEVLDALRKKLNREESGEAAELREKVARLKKVQSHVNVLFDEWILHSRLQEIDRQRIKLPFFSPNGLRETKDLNEAVELLGSAKQLKVYGDMIPGKWNDDHSEYTPYLTVPLDVDSPDTIRKLTALLRSAEFKFDPQMTQDWKDGVKIGTTQHFLFEVDDTAYIYILSDMLICQDHKTYITKKYEDDEETYLMEQLALVLKTFADKRKDKMPNQSIQPTK